MMTEPRCTGTKRCPQCGEEKHVLAFGVDGGTHDGLRSWCRDCTNEAAQRARAAERARRRTRFDRLRYSPGPEDLVDV